LGRRRAGGCGLLVLRAVVLVSCGDDGRRRGLDLDLVGVVLLVRMRMMMVVLGRLMMRMVVVVVTMLRGSLLDSCLNVLLSRVFQRPCMEVGRVGCKRLRSMLDGERLSIDGTVIAR
jgi:hypothetical protein